MKKITPIHGGHLRGSSNKATAGGFGKTARPLQSAGLTPTAGRGQRRKLSNVGVTSSRVGKLKV